MAISLGKMESAIKESLDATNTTALELAQSATVSLCWIGDCALFLDATESPRKAAPNADLHTAWSTKDADWNTASR